MPGKWTLFEASLGHFFFCWELSVHISSPLFNWTIYILDSWLFELFLYILDSDPLDVSLAMLLSLSVGLFFASPIVHIDVQKLFSLWGSTCQLLPFAPEQVLSYSEIPFLHPPISYALLRKMLSFFPFSTFLLSFIKSFFGDLNFYYRGLSAPWLGIV